VARMLFPSTRQVIISVFFDLLIVFIPTLYLNAQALSIVTFTLSVKVVLRILNICAILLEHGI
jgi:hypothetical protein